MPPRDVSWAKQRLEHRTVAEGQTGFLGSAISGEALAEALSRALKARTELREFGRRARKVVIGKFSEGQMIASHRRVYESGRRQESGARSQKLAEQSQSK